jgi:hypothetical protein
MPWSAFEPRGYIIGMIFMKALRDPRPVTSAISVGDIKLEIDK